MGFRTNEILSQKPHARFLALYIPGSGISADGPDSSLYVVSYIHFPKWILYVVQGNRQYT